MITVRLLHLEWSLGPCAELNGCPMCALFGFQHAGQHLLPHLCAAWSSGPALLQEDHRHKGNCCSTVTEAGTWLTYRTHQHVRKYPALSDCLSRRCKAVGACTLGSGDSGGLSCSRPSTRCCMWEQHQQQDLRAAEAQARMRSIRYHTHSRLANSKQGVRYWCPACSHHGSRC